MLCYRCGGHVKDGAGRCVTCGQQFDPALKAGPAAGFGVGVKRPRSVEGAPCQAGDRVAGRYEIREHAGSGPLGWMYRGVEIANDGEVAIKVLSPRFLQMPEEKRTFLEELHKAQRLAHPNIARIYEAGDDAGRPFIAAQYLEGLTLRRIMDLRRQKGQRFTLQEVEPIVAQIAAALDMASASFAHGDLKPDNVIVLPDLLKLTDFGLAVSLPRAPFMAAQKAAGAHRYLAPEFLLGEPLDARTDVFSLGVLLGEMLSGAVFEAQLSLLEKDPELPEPVEALFRRAVSPRPGARYPSAGEMAAELSELVAAVPRPPPAPKPLAEDAGDVVIVEQHTDPRLRIARALGATRAADPATTPQPPLPVPPEPPAAARAAEADTTAQAPRDRAHPAATASPARDHVIAPLEPAALAALSALPLPVEPFTPPPPYEPPARPSEHRSFAPREEVNGARPAAGPAVPAYVPAPAIQAMVAAAPVAPALATAAPAVAATPPISDPEPPVAPVAEPPPVSAELREIAESVGATPELLTAETVVRAAPTDPEPKDRPRRGAGKRKDKHKGRGRRSMPPGGVPDPEWASSTPPTEGALAIGPTTPALEPIQPEARIETPAPVKPVKPMTRPPTAPVSFAAMEDQRPSRAPLFAVGTIMLLVAIGGAWSFLSRSSAPAPEAKAEETAKAEPQKPAQPPAAAKPEPAKAEPAKVEPPKQAAKKSRDVEPPAHSMRDRVRAVKERVEKALEDRRRKREEAIAAAKAKRAAEEKPAPARAQPETFSEQTIRPIAQPKPLPPAAGAITGAGDGDVMVSKDRGRTVAAVNAAYTTAAAVKDFSCPPGMQKVPGGTAAIGSDGSDDLRNFGDRPLTRVELKPYCIDQYEFPNQPGKLPKVAAPFAEAEALCKNAGKRLCSEDEWEAACRGPQNLRFPYGTRYDPGACNTADAKDNPRQTSVAGAFSHCKSGYGVWDLSGNAAEWTASPFDGQGADKTVKGGHAARPGFDDRCASRRKLAPGAHSISVGFRCCADAR